MDNVAFCFIVKDGDKYLQNNIDRLIKFAKLNFKEYKFFYAENDSKDNTVNILKKYKKEYFNFNGEHLLLDGKHSTELCNYELEYNCKKRTRRLAYLRNIVLNMAKEWKECDFLLMLDMDFVDFDENELYNMFNIIRNNKNINGIFGMSVIKNKYWYDTGAIKPVEKLISIMNNEKLVKVQSAFSGFGLYRMKIINDKNLEYNIKTNEIEHIDFNKKINNLYVYTLFKPNYNGFSYWILCYEYCMKYGNILFIILAIIVFILFINRSNVKN